MMSQQTSSGMLSVPSWSDAGNCLSTRSPLWRRPSLHLPHRWEKQRWNTVWFYLHIVDAADDRNVFSRCLAAANLTFGCPFSEDHRYSVPKQRRFCIPAGMQVIAIYRSGFAHIITSGHMPTFFSIEESCGRCLFLLVRYCAVQLSSHPSIPNFV